MALSEGGTLFTNCCSGTLIYWRGHLKQKGADTALPRAPHQREDGEHVRGQES